MTPDVLDYLTSNWGKRKFLFEKIKLIIFDELHLIVEKKYGSTIEVLISRINMLNQINNSQIRLLGLLTSMGNGTDVAEWFNVATYNFFNFKPQVRPIPINLTVEGFSEKTYSGRMSLMNKPAYNAIKKFSYDKSVLVFVSSKKQCRMTALDLINIALRDAGGQVISPFLRCSEEEIQAAINAVTDEFLKESLIFGVGM